MGRHTDGLVCVVYLSSFLLLYFPAVSLLRPVNKQVELGGWEGEGGAGELNIAVTSQTVAVSNFVVLPRSVHKPRSIWVIVVSRCPTTFAI